MGTYSQIIKCRICGNRDLIPILHLGNQCLTGIFPRNREQKITSGPLELVKCNDSGNAHHCGLVQLRHSYDHLEMYGNNYGYRSGLNKSMVSHLRKKVEKIQSFVELEQGDLIIDIGSNDSTLLKAYQLDGLLLVGVDPAGEKFRKYYPGHVHLIPDFFSEAVVKKNFGRKKAKVVTSIAMFYDLESPVDFAKQIEAILADDGIWIFEQSYLPMMLEMNAYDTVCHEHLEYYSLKQIKWIMEKAGLKIIDVEFNKVNGGSFSVIVAKTGSFYAENEKLVEDILSKESGLRALTPYEKFGNRVLNSRDELAMFFQGARRERKTVFGYGASTKGNVILQFCHITDGDMPFIAEVNSDKFGCYTPQTHIPIISEEEAKKMNPDYFLVLPWHFKEHIIERESKYLASGGKLVFPLPYLEIIKR